LADDDTLAAGNRKAAELMVTAETTLMDNGDHEGALSLATQAFEAFCNANDVIAQADAMRLVIHAYIAQADAAMYDGGSGAENQAADIYDKAEKKAKDQLKRFKDLGNVRGQGCMTLSLAELADGRRKTAEPDELREVLRLAEQAKGCFVEAGDKKMEALAQMIIVPTQYRRHEKEDASLATEAALSIFQTVGDKAHEAKALQLMSYAHIIRNELEESIQVAQDALAIFREQSSRFMEAFCLFMMAEYYLHFRKGRDALPLAEDALELFRELKWCKGWEAYAIDAIVQAHLLRGEDRKALAVAQEAVEAFQESNDKRSTAVALHSVVSALMITGEYEECLKAVEEEQSAVQDLGDPRWEAGVLLDVATVHLAKGSFDAAADAANEAIEIYQGIKDRQGEAFAMNKLNEVHLSKFDDAAVLQTATEQRAIFQELEDKSRAASCQLTIAGLTAAERFDEAYALAEEAQEWFQDARDKEGEGRALNFMAQFHCDKEDYEQAVEKAKEMRECLREFGHKTLEANACRVLCDFHLKFGNPAEAVRAARDGLTLVKKAMDKREIVDYLLLVSNATMELIQKEAGEGAGAKGIEKALRPAKEALTVAKSLSKGKNGQMGSALYQIACVQMLCARANEAMQAVREAVDIFRAVNDKASEASAVVLIAEIHHMSGMQEKALDAAEEGLALAGETADPAIKKRAEDLIEKIKGKPRLTFEQVGGMAAVPVAGLPAVEGGGAAPAAAQSVVEAKPKGLDPEEVEKVVQEMAKAAIGLDDAVYLDSPLMDSGMDSLTAVSFRNGLQQQLGVKLPSSLMFDYPTMKEVAGRIVELSLEDE